MLTSIFIKVLMLSISSTVLIMIIYTLRTLIDNRLGTVWKYYAWLIVIIQFANPLVLKLNWFSNINIYDIFNSKTKTVAEKTEPMINHSLLNQIDIQDMDLMNIIIKNQQPPIKDIKNDIKATNTINIIALIPIFWLVGMCVSLILLFFNYIFVMYHLCRYNIPLEDKCIMDIYIECSKRLNLKKYPKLYLNKHINTPMFLGLFRQCILIPEKELNNSNLRFIFIHELIHYKRKDLYYKWTAELIKSVHWFNPFAYIVSDSINQDCEMSCDEIVINKLGLNSVADYGETLITMVTNKRSIIATTAMLSDKKKLKRRITNMMNFIPHGKKTIFISIIIISALFFAGLTIGAMTGSITDNDTGKISNETSTNIENGTPELIEVETNKLVSIEGHKENFYTMLILGKDKTQKLTDIIMVASLDIRNGDANVVSIPRDTYVKVDDKEMKINEAYAYGGNEFTKQAVKDIIGFEPDYLTAIDLDGFKEIVDYVGGIEFDVPQDMDYEDPVQNLYIHLKKGLQTLDGEQAMQLIRFRMYSDGDISRVKMQQEFLGELVEKILSKEMVTNSYQILNLVKHVDTNMPLNDIPTILIEILKQKDNLELGFAILPGEVIRYNLKAFFLPNKDETLALVNNTINPYNENITEENLNIIAIAK